MEPNLTKDGLWLLGARALLFISDLNELYKKAVDKGDKQSQQLIGEAISWIKNAESNLEKVKNNLPN